jgi:hypothetical protein
MLWVATDPDDPAVLAHDVYAAGVVAIAGAGRPDRVALSRQ